MQLSNGIQLTGILLAHQAFLNGGKNNCTNIFSLNWKKGRWGFSLFLCGVEIHIPGSAVECSLGNLHLPSAYIYLLKKCAVCKWYLPCLKQIKYKECPLVQWLYGICPWAARLGLTKEKRDWLALSESLMYRNETEIPLHSVLRGFTSFGDGQKLFFS